MPPDPPSLGTVPRAIIYSLYEKSCINKIKFDNRKEVSNLYVKYGG
jgi:hypothetical protein